MFLPISIRKYLKIKYFLIAILFCFQNSFGQTDSAVDIKELGWTIQLPPELKVIDTATLGAERRNEHITWIRKPPVDSNKLHTKLIFTARDSSLQTIFFITYIDAKYDPLNGKFPDNTYTNFIITLRKKPSTVVYSGVKFLELQLDGHPLNALPYVAVTLKTKYQGKIFTIDYAYSDPIKGNEIEHMLKTSKFDR
jgi:hypothetical protein